MKARLSFILLLFVSVILYSESHEDDHGNRVSLGDAEYKETVRRGDSVNIEHFDVRLVARRAALLRDTEFSVRGLREGELPPMEVAMELQTGGAFAGYRLLPHGEHFSEPAVLALKYDPVQIPMGYRVEDINTYYYNEEHCKWEALERAYVDTLNHTYTPIQHTSQIL